MLKKDGPRGIVRSRDAFDPDGAVDQHARPVVACRPRQRGLLPPAAETPQYDRRTR
jgi:hypothetical protein